MPNRRTTNDDFKDFVLDQLSRLGPMQYFKCQPMFGGYGLYLQKIFFGIIHDSRLFFRVTDATQPAFDAAGSETFQPRPNLEMKGYREVPADIIDAPEKLTDFAYAAAEVPTLQRRNLRP